jgi:hypothetical protein
VLLATAAVIVVLALVAGTASVWGDGRSTSGSAPATAGSGGPTGTSRGGGPATTAPPAKDTPAGVKAVEAEVARLRGLKFLRPVPVTLESPAKVSRELLRTSEDASSKAALTRQARALVQLGELNQGVDLYAQLRSVQAESVLGFYVPGKPPRKGRLFVRSDRGLDPYARIVLSHELTHAVTDQHFDLTHADKLSAGDADDQATAYSALVEGDATVLMQVYQAQALSPEEQQAANRAGAAERTPKLDAAAPIVRESLLFPYAAGSSFVRTLFQRGGWDAVNRAYRDPPTSTEQLLHPEKYLGKRDVPQDVKVPDLRGALGAGWSEGTRNEWGEFDTRLLLEGSFPVTTAERAAAGWDGGELRSFDKARGTAVVLRTVWDSPAEAREYCTAMSRWATVRLGRPVSGNRWSGSIQQGALLCSGSRAAWLSAPDNRSLDAMVRGLGGP